MSCQGGCAKLPNSALLKLEVLKLMPIGNNVTSEEITARAKACYKFVKGNISDKALDAQSHKGQTQEARRAFLASPVDPSDNPNYVWSQYLMDPTATIGNAAFAVIFALAGLKLRMTTAEIGEWLRNGA